MSQLTLNFGLAAVSFLSLSALDSRAAPIDWDSQPGSLGFPAIRLNDDVWMDISVTQGMSHNQVIAEIGPGLRFEGWTVATAAQARGLMGAAGLVAGQSLSNRLPAINLLAIWGGAYRYRAFEYGAAFTVADLGTPFPERQYGAYRYDETWGWNNCCGDGEPDDRSAPDRGVALVRSIPEPSSNLLVLAALGAAQLVPIARMRWARNSASPR